MKSYDQFLASKRKLDPMTGISENQDLLPALKPHQRDIVAWALRRGRAAIFAGCVAGDTLLSTLAGDVAIEELAAAGKPIVVRSLDENGHTVFALASAPFRKGRADLFRFILASGLSIVVTAKHRFLTPSGWKFAAFCVAGERLLAFASIQSGSNLGSFQATYRLDDPRSIGIDQDCLDRCFGDCRLYDAQLHPGADSALSSVPLQGGALELAGLLSRMGDPENRRGRTHHHLNSALPSTPGSYFQDSCIADALECRIPPFDQEQPASCIRKSSQFRLNSCFEQQDREVRFPEDGLFLASQSLASGTSFCDTVVSANYIANDDFYDLFVPRYENYLANGLWHHNTGLGKTLMELEWARNVAAYTNKPVLVFAPLAVSAQHVREGAHFGVPAYLARDQDDVRGGPHSFVTNYQKMAHFDLSQFGGIVLDESSVLKNVDGHYRSRLIEECAQIPFRLAATATPAPNDFMELGNHAEFLGVMSYTDMLATYFTHDGSETQKWRLKGHAENEFWRWLASWAVMLQKPSDLGYDNAGYDLPPLNQTQHVASVPYAPNLDSGLLFPMEATSLSERIGARRASVEDRVKVAIDITPSDKPFVWWCNLNTESEALKAAIPGAVEITGSESDEAKERKLIDFSEGRIRVLVTKSKIAGWGMNWQHCADTGFIGASDSFESVYQSIRRFWRFGQTKPVNVHFVTAETEGAVVANFRRKEQDAERMAAAMLAHMTDLSAKNIRGMERTVADYNPQQPIIIPSWLEYAS